MEAYKQEFIEFFIMPPFQEWKKPYNIVFLRFLKSELCLKLIVTYHYLVQFDR